ncbi:MAG: nucleotidyltransferase family protein [Pseudomonadota bacterium]
MKDPKIPMAGIVLAAGMSTRLGSAKQLVRAGEQCLIDRVLDGALASCLDRIVLVLGHRAGEVSAALKEREDRDRLRILLNPAYRDGMSSSLRTGTESVQDTFSSIMVLLGDQPFVGADLIDLLIRRFRSSQKDICVPVCRGRRGHPVIIGRRFFDAVISTTGDIGAREVLRANPESVLSVEISDSRIFFDVDTREDIENLQYRKLK